MLRVLRIYTACPPLDEDMPWDTLNEERYRLQEEIALIFAASLGHTLDDIHVLVDDDSQLGSWVEFKVSHTKTSGQDIGTSDSFTLVRDRTYNVDFSNQDILYPYAHV